MGSFANPLSNEVKGINIGLSIPVREIQVKWIPLGTGCHLCMEPLQANGVDDVAYCRTGTCPNITRLHCPKCGNAGLELQAELDNGQQIFYCQNCKLSGLAHHRGVRFVAEAKGGPIVV